MTERPGPERPGPERPGPDLLGELRDTAARFVDGHFPIDRLRELRDAADPGPGVSGAWAELARLGWAGLLVPSDYGGSDAGMAATAVVMEQLGRRLAVTPMLETGVVAASLIAGCGSDAQRASLLPAIAAGERCVVLAHEETRRFTGTACKTTATRSRDGYRLDGTKRFVVLGPVASTLLVTARVDDGSEAAFVVERDAPGVALRTGTLIDAQPVAEVALAVDVEPGARLGNTVDIRGGLDGVFTRGAVALSAWMLGGLQRALELTVEYLKVREQFGVPIGAFQALQHRAAGIACEAALCDAIVHRAAAAIDAGEPSAARLAHACKARLSEAFLHAAEEGIQMHGGIGMTDEADMGFYLKAARVAEFHLGDARYHHLRYAGERGY